MFIVWGFKARFSDIDSGTFACPNEGGDRSYVRQMARKWFTLFWIPLIPLKELGEIVTCSSCGGQFDPRVLTVPTAATMDATLRESLRHLVVGVMGEGDVLPQEEQAAVAVLHRAGMTDYDVAALRHDRQTIRTDRLEDELVNISGLLTADGREQVLRAAMTLAAADGEVDDREREILTLAGVRLGMSEAHVRGVLQEVPDPVAQWPDETPPPPAPGSRANDNPPPLA